MPKILLTKDRKVDVTREEAQRVESELLSNEKMIRVTDALTVKRGEIKGVDKGGSGAIRYNLGDISDKQVIRDFESMLLSVESASQDPPHDLSWYGHVMKSRGGYVNNEILGAVHWSVVQHAIDQKLICRLEKQYVGWVIMNEGDERIPRCGMFNDFKAKLDALAELRSRRVYAQQKEAEGQAIVIEQEMQEFSQRTLMPKVETGELSF